MAGPIRISVLADGSSARRELDSVSRSGSRMGQALAAAGRIAITGLAIAGGAAVVAGAKFATAAAQDQQAAALMAKTFQNAAGATRGQIAATEDWITAQGKAFGVTDDELRPALSRLVTATHDVGKAQKLASLAMNVSAGTGKSLETVSTALMKAQNGQVSSLSRLGINTKNAAGETITMAEATRRMSDTFGGAAKAKAQTLQGQLDRLKVTVSEAGEAIGYKILPPLLQFARYVQSTIVPAAKNVGAELKARLGPALADVGRLIVDTIVPAVQQLAPRMLEFGVAALQVAGFLAQHRTALVAVAAAISAVVVVTKLHSAAMAVQAAGGLAALIKGLPIVSALTKAYAAVQWVLNAAMSANPIGLVVVAIAALVVGFVIAYKKSETFRNIVNAAFEGVKKVVSAVVGWFKSWVPQAFAFVVAAVKTYITVYKTVVTTAFNVVKNVVTTVLGAVKGVVTTVWNAVSAVVRTEVSVVRTVVTTAFGAVRTVVRAVMTAVKAVVQTEIAGVKAAFNGIATLVGKVREWFGNMLDAIKTKLGEAVTFVKGVPGKIIDAVGNLGSTLYNAGRDVIAGLIRGIQDKLHDLGGALGGVSSFITSHKGPPSYDRVMLVPHGRLIMDGLIQGIDDGIKALGDKLGEVGDALREGLEKQRDKVRSAIDSIRSDFASLKDAVAGAFSGNLFEADNTADFVTGLRDTYLNLGALKTAFKKLVKMGVAPGFLSQLFQSGNSALILDLASGPRGQARQAATLFGGIEDLSGQLGGQVARNTLAPRIDEVNRQLRLIQHTIDRRLDKSGSSKARFVASERVTASRATARPANLGRGADDAQTLSLLQAMRTELGEMKKEIRDLNRTGPARAGDAFGQRLNDVAADAGRRRGRT